MRNPYKILYQGGTAEITEKKSRFIASLRPVQSEEEALYFWKRRERNTGMRAITAMPGSLGKTGSRNGAVMTASHPRQRAVPCWMLLEGEGICNACAVVTRYFGGTLLGTGGLVRAYSGAVQAGLRAVRCWP